MKAAALKDIKRELETQQQTELLSVCLRLARFKKENKELLTYLLFESGNENNFVASVKSDMDLAFGDLNTKNSYIAKKNLRKILRELNRYIRYSGIKTTEVSLLIYYCTKIKISGLKLDKSAALYKIYTSQLKKISVAIDTLHEDLQYDYRKELELI